MSTLYGIALREGEPAEGVSVRLMNPDGNLTNEVKTAADGTFIFPVTKGTWTLQWSTDGEPNEGQIQIQDEEDAEIELEV